MSASRRSVAAISSLCLASVPAFGLALIGPPPPKAVPVIFGTSDYCTVLYGKAQRASSVFGTNLGHPLAVISSSGKDSAGALEKCLWEKFGMSTAGPGGTIEEDDVLRPLSDWIPQADLEGALVFIDASTGTAVQSSGGGDDGSDKGFFFGGALSFFGGKKEEEENSSPEDAVDEDDDFGAGGGASSPEATQINTALLQCAVERHCAHIYVLSDDASLESCLSTMEEYCGGDRGASSSSKGEGEERKGIPYTILALEKGVSLTTTDRWQSSRPQDVEGELTGPVALTEIPLSEDGTPADQKPGRRPRIKSFPAEDAAEVMLQVALRADRSPSADAGRRRVCRLRIPNGRNEAAGSLLEERRNEDYFTRTGGKKMREAAGTVRSADWGTVLAPLGKVLAKVSDRPDL